MSYDFDRFIDRDGTNSVKWEFMQESDPEVPPGTIPLWIADMDFPCAQPMIEALRERVDRLIFGYSSNGTSRFYRAVCGWYQHRFGWYLNSESIVFSPGVIPAIGYLIDILTEPGDGVIIQRPVYYPFTRTVVNHGRTVINNPLVCRDGRYEMDIPDLDAKMLDPTAKLLVLCSPHNPVGRVWSESELGKLRSLFERTNIAVISDEIHCDLVRGGVVHTPLEKVFPEFKDRIITATAPSKTFNVAGMQLSNIVIHDPRIRDRWREYVVGRLGLKRPTALAIVAAESAFGECEEWLEEVRAYLDGNFMFLQTFLEDALPKATCVTPEGTYLAWIDVRAYRFEESALMRSMVREGRVFAEGGSLFGVEGTGYIRINVACARSVLGEGLRRMAAILGRIQSQDIVPAFRCETPWKANNRRDVDGAGNKPLSQSQ